MGYKNWTTRSCLLSTTPMTHKEGVLEGDQHSKARIMSEFWTQEGIVTMNINCWIQGGHVKRRIVISSIQGCILLAQQYAYTRQGRIPTRQSCALWIIDVIAALIWLVYKSNYYYIRRFHYHYHFLISSKSTTIV